MSHIAAASILIHEVVNEVKKALPCSKSPIYSEHPENFFLKDSITVTKDAKKSVN
jgi:hypothetical protein